MENNVLKIQKIEEIENEIKGINEKIIELEKYSDKKVEKLKNNIKRREIIEKILVILRNSGIFLGFSISGIAGVWIILGILTVEILFNAVSVKKKRELQKTMEYNIKNKGITSYIEEKKDICEIILKYCNNISLTDDEVYKLSKRGDIYKEVADLRDEISDKYPQFNVDKEKIKQESIDNKISDKDIIVDINNMKENRRLILDELTNSKRIEELNKKKDTTQLIGLVAPEVCLTLFFLSGFIFGFNNFTMILYIIGLTSGSLILSYSRKLNSKINKYSSLKKSTEKSIDEFIENHESILENRKGKILENNKIKNLNIYFDLDSRFSYDLKQINDKFQLMPSDMELDKTPYILLDDFYKEIEEELPELELIKRDSKIKILRY